ncbi:hypothetical protein L3X38_036081 [Prunus dulcis]|uniref:Uncharacterized protein n=1 Tax=Prunus dulcis TaxID=3755 RepID=A0AAD4YPG3_PRUDU|nr:hypothetical protein L3X38_036081 [Prunus dulcis]
MVTKSKEKADDTFPTDSNLPNDMWQLHVDGASNHKGARAGVVIITPDGTLLEQAITLGFSASNNEAEYGALLAGLRLAKELTIKRLAIYSDSQLITNQASSEYMAKHPRMIQYLDKVQGLLKEFPTFTIQQVPRAKNTHADALASLGSALDTQFRRSIPVEHLDRPSIEEMEPIDSMQIDEDPSWQDSIIDYLVNGNLPTDKSEVRKVQQKAARYYMQGDKLIRRSYFGPHLTCIKYPQTLEVFCKIHDGECGNHFGGRSLAQKALNAGYFWPTMRHDSTEYVKRCDRCQRYKPVPNLPAEIYHPQNSPLPFMQWAIDLIEAEALSSTKEDDVERFIWRNIICRFGCPQSLVTDNDSQFIGKQITAFFKKYGIKQHLSTPRYPQGNGQAEASNKIILDCLKKRLEGTEGKWVDELPGVLWAYRTTMRRSTGETPFSLGYGTEAIIPPHITVPSIGIEVGSIEQNFKQMRLNLDLLEGKREKAIVRASEGLWPTPPGCGLLTPIFFTGIEEEREGRLKVEGSRSEYSPVRLFAQTVWSSSEGLFALGGLSEQYKCNETCAGLRELRLLEGCLEFIGEPKRAELKEEWKKLHVAELELVIKRGELAKLILEALK